MGAILEAYITNLGKYAEGQLVGETLKFPTTTEEVQALLKRIGVDGVRYEEIFITSFDSDGSGNVQIQKAVLLLLGCCDLPFHMGKHPFVVHLFGHLGQHRNQRIDDGILIFHHLGENLCQNLIQLLAADLGCRAGFPAFHPVDLALPHLLIPCCALQQGIRRCGSARSTG